MSDYQLTYVPDPILREKAKKITHFGPELRELAESMVQTMRDNRGIGLAASQVGQALRMICVEYVPEEKGDPNIPLTILVNPTITDSNKVMDSLDEGCLSIPGVELPIKRPTQVNVLAEDLNGNRIKIRAKDLFARILQHEIDHTNGILIADRAFPDLKQLAGLRVVVMGTPEHVNPYITAIASTEMNIVGVVTETDKPAGRNRELTPPPVKRHAEILGIPVFQYESLKNEDSKKHFESLQPEVVIVVAYGKIIPKDWLDIPKHGFLNIHYSLLPEFRGASPHQSAILSGKKETGFSIFRLEPGMDTGPILTQRKVAIAPQDTSEALIYKMVPLSIVALFQSLPAYIRGNKKLTPQNHELATKTTLFSKEDGRINWQQPAEVIDRHIRAMTPWPGAFTDVDGERVIIRDSQLLNGKIHIKHVQPAGKKIMLFSDYLRGSANRLTFFQKLGIVNLDNKKSHN